MIPRRLKSLILPMFLLSGTSHGAIDFKTQIYPILEAHCFKCHGEKKQKGDLRLDTLSTDFLNDRAAAETWHDIRDVLNLGEMPPEDEESLSFDELQFLTGWITKKIDCVIEAKKRTEGRVVLRRLNRNEYQNTMRDLLDFEMDYVRDWPKPSSPAPNLKPSNKNSKKP